MIRSYLCPARQILATVLLHAALFGSDARSAPPLPSHRPMRALPAFATATEALQPGAWVSYAVVNRRTGQSLLVRLAALEHEAAGQWIEIELTDELRRKLLVKALVEGKLAQPRRILQTIVQPAGHKALLLPERLAADALPSFSDGAGRGARRLGRGTVKVRAGTFTAEHFRRPQAAGEPAADVWLSGEVPGWPLVKAISGDVVVELTGHGSGARSRVRGRPAKLDEKLLEELGP